MTPATAAWEHRGLATSRAGLELLLREQRHRLKASLSEEEAAALQELRAGGMLDAQGHLTPSGARLTDVIAGHDRHVRVEATAALAPLTFDAYRQGDVCVLVVTDPPAWWTDRKHSGDEIAAMADRVWLQEVPTAYLPTALAAWLGVGPDGPRTIRPRALPTADVLARVDDPDTPTPDGADEALCEVWRQPWFLWTLQTSQETALAGVGAGACGHLALRRDDDDAELVWLQPWPAETVRDSLAEATLG